MKETLKQRIKNVRELGGTVFNREWIVIGTTPPVMVEDSGLRGSDFISTSKAKIQDIKKKLACGFAGYNLRTEKITKTIYILQEDLKGLKFKQTILLASKKLKMLMK